MKVSRQLLLSADFWRFWCPRPGGLTKPPEIVQPVGPPAPACSTCSSRMGENPCFTMSSRSSRCSIRLRGEPRVKQRCQPPLDTRNQDGRGVGSGCTARSMRHEYGMLSQRTHLSSRRMPSAAAHAGEGRAADAIRHRAVARTCLARCASSDARQKNSVCLPRNSVCLPIDLKRCRAASRDGIPAEICYEKFGAFGITRTCSTWAWDVCMAAMHIRR